MVYMKEALSKYQEILNNLEFGRELQKSFLALGQEVSPEFQFLEFADHFICSTIFNSILH